MLINISIKSFIIQKMKCGSSLLRFAAFSVNLFVLNVFRFRYSDDQSTSVGHLFCIAHSRLDCQKKIRF